MKGIARARDVKPFCPRSKQATFQEERSKVSRKKLAFWQQLAKACGSLILRQWSFWVFVQILGFRAEVLGWSNEHQDSAWEGEGTETHPAST